MIIPIFRKPKRSARIAIGYCRTTLPIAIAGTIDKVSIEAASGVRATTTGSRVISAKVDAAGNNTGHRNGRCAANQQQRHFTTIKRNFGFMLSQCINRQSADQRQDGNDEKRVTVSNPNSQIIPGRRKSEANGRCIECHNPGTPLVGGYACEPGLRQHPMQPQAKTPDETDAKPECH